MAIGSFSCRLSCHHSCERLGCILLCTLLACYDFDPPAHLARFMGGLTSSDIRWYLCTRSQGSRSVHLRERCARQGGQVCRALDTCLFFYMWASCLDPLAFHSNQTTNSFQVWIFYNIKKEMRHFIITRQQHLIERTHSKSVQANTILITGIPKKYLTQDALYKLFNELPGGVKKIWINRQVLISLFLLTP